ELETLQQDVTYLPKRYSNVRDIELRRMYRLTYNSIEVIKVSVPRNKKEYFQDELFPDTMDVETPVMESKDFFDLNQPIPRPHFISLCPHDMEPCMYSLFLSYYIIFFSYIFILIS